MNVYFPPELLQQISDLADRKGLSRSAIVEAAVGSFLSPDGSERLEAAFTRRLDRLSRQNQRFERNVSIAIETLALFIRFCVVVTPPMPTGDARNRTAHGPAAVSGVRRGAREAPAERAELVAGGYGRCWHPGPAGAA
jgi:hypothetical protein